MITFEQVMQDIKSGKSKMIYYSSRALWWTHLDEDLKESTEQGLLAQKISYETMMKRSDIPESEKKKMTSLRSMMNSGHQIPLDPSGCPLMQMDKPLDWMITAEKKPDHFGQYKLEAFMISHHQNCGGKVFSKWDGYNAMIAIEKMKGQGNV